MDHGVWATWYDIDKADEARFLDWIHGTYIPFLMQIPGYAWAAHYFNQRGGPAMREYDKIVTRTMDEEIGTGGQYVLLVGAGSPHTFFKPLIREVAEPDEYRSMLALRRGVRSGRRAVSMGVGTVTM